MPDTTCIVIQIALRTDHAERIATTVEAHEVALLGEYLRGLVRDVIVAKANKEAAL